MSSVGEKSANEAGSPPVTPGEMRLEVVVVPVSDVDRAKGFYESLGWRLDADLAVDDGYRVVQLTPPGSGCSIIEIGYWVLPHARRRGIATRLARLLAEHAFSLGLVRVAAFVNVGNVASERVLERAGFAREGVVRSMPVPSGARIDKTLFSLLASE